MYQNSATICLEMCSPLNNQNIQPHNNGVNNEAVKHSSSKRWFTIEETWLQNFNWNIRHDKPKTRLHSHDSTYPSVLLGGVGGQMGRVYNSVCVAHGKYKCLLLLYYYFAIKNLSPKRPTHPSLHCKSQRQVCNSHLWLHHILTHELRCSKKKKK